MRNKLRLQVLLACSVILAGCLSMAMILLYGGDLLYQTPLGLMVIVLIGAAMILLGVALNTLWDKEHWQEIEALEHLSHLAYQEAEKYRKEKKLSVLILNRYKYYLMSEESKDQMATEIIRLINEHTAE